MYLKHIKNGYIEMNQIHMTAMKPLTNLLESNLNFHYLELIEKKKEVPSFRHEALEEKFSDHLTLIIIQMILQKEIRTTRVCEIFRDYGNLKDPFHIKQMLHVLKTRNWSSIPLFQVKFFIKPLHDALTDVRQWLLKMNEDGILRCKYIIEDNTELMEKTIQNILQRIYNNVTIRIRIFKELVNHLNQIIVTIVMVQKDMTAQWLGGDELKQDQFKFIYKVIKVIYDCALKDVNNAMFLYDALLNEEARVLDHVLPNLVAYHSVLNIKSIMDTKMAERKKLEEKAEREGRKVTFGGTGNFEEEKKGMIIKYFTNSLILMMTEEQIYRQRIEAQLNKSTTSQFSSDAQKQKEAERNDIEQYGRMWVWDGYINPQKKEQFLACAEKLRHVNPHVVQDIEDYIYQGFQFEHYIINILLEGFKGKRMNDVKKIIENDVNARRMKKKNRSKDDEEEEKVIDNKRNFLNHMRPPFCWNFFEDSEDKTPHVLRAEADPKRCYIDGRIENIMQDIEEIGHHLAHYEETNWKRLRTFTIEIFKHMSKHENDEGEETKKNN